jgi:hypothetical protein
MIVLYLSVIVINVVIVLFVKVLAEPKIAQIILTIILKSAALFTAFMCVVKIME